MGIDVLISAASNRRMRDPIVSSYRLLGYRPPQVAEQKSSEVQGSGFG